MSRDHDPDDAQQALLPPHGMPPSPSDGGKERPCITCREPTPWETLHNHGGRCMRCYLAYQREPMAMRPRSRYAQQVFEASQRATETAEAALPMATIDRQALPPAMRRGPR